MLLEMVSGFSHELSQPLSAILAYASAQRQMLKAGASAPGQLEHSLEKIAEQAERAAEFIRRVRGLVRRSLPQPALHELGAVLARALQRVDARLRETGVEVRIRAGGSASAPSVWADTEQLEQALVQVLANSIEALESRPAGAARQIHIEVRAGDPSVELTVRDTGPGFGDLDVDAAFMPFASTKSEHLGLGLSLARSLIDAQNGRLWAESDAQGAVLKLVLPAGRQP